MQKNGNLRETSNNREIKRKNLGETVKIRLIEMIELYDNTCLWWEAQLGKKTVNPDLKILMDFFYP